MSGGAAGSSPSSTADTACTASGRRCIGFPQASVTRTKVGSSVTAIVVSSVSMQRFLALVLERQRGRIRRRRDVALDQLARVQRVVLLRRQLAVGILPVDQLARGPQGQDPYADAIRLRGDQC